MNAEGYRLMMYATEDGRIEWIWNSRKGVTPFGVSHPDDRAPMKHVDWFRDVYAPYFVPPIGSRVFVDLTETRARHFAQLRLERMLDDPEHAARIKERYPSPEAFIDAIAADMLRPGVPDVLVVNKAMQDEFRARVPRVPPPLAGKRFA